MTAGRAPQLSRHRRRLGALAAALTIGGLLWSTVPAGAVTSMTDHSAERLARPVLEAHQALVLAGLSVVTLAVWVLVLILSKPLVQRAAQVRRFRAELRGVERVSRAWRSQLVDEP